MPDTGPPKRRANAIMVAHALTSPTPSSSPDAAAKDHQKETFTPETEMKLLE